MQKRFFTLVEILTVVAIMAILAGITVGVVGLVNNKNAEARTLATIKALELALAQYKTENGTFYFQNGQHSQTVRLDIPNWKRVDKNKPSPFEEYVSNASTYKTSLLKFIDQKLVNLSTVQDSSNPDICYFVDGWGHPLIYRVPGRFNKTGFDLGSVGPNGKIGENGTAITTSVPASISDYDAKFGQDDDIVNFLRN